MKKLEFGLQDIRRDFARDAGGTDVKENYDSKEKNTHEKERQHAVAEPQVSGTKVREILEESSTEQEVSSGADGVYTYRHCDTYEVANRLNAMLPAAHAAEQPKENWEPVRGQYVWVEGKLTENQPETFPKKLRVYVHGVGTGIAENVRPVTETEAEQPKLTADIRECLRLALEWNDDYMRLNNLHGKVEWCEWARKLLTSPVAPPPRTLLQVVCPECGYDFPPRVANYPNAHCPNCRHNFNYAATNAPPVAPGEQPRDPLDDNYQTWIAAQPPAQEWANHHFIQGFLWAECSCGWHSVICAHQECNELFAEHLAAQPSPQDPE